jgi:hypothetical protein
MVPVIDKAYLGIPGNIGTPYKVTNCFVVCCSTYFHSLPSYPEGCNDLVKYVPIEPMVEVSSDMLSPGPRTLIVGIYHHLRALAFAPHIRDIVQDLDNARSIKLREHVRQPIEIRLIPLLADYMV